MISHQELIAELPVVSSMSTEERLSYAQRKRNEQLKRWYDNEASRSKKNSANSDHGHPTKSKTVSFEDCITLLEAAARNDYTEVKELLQQKVNPNESNDDGLTALHQACIDNFEDIVELLLDNNANVDAVDSECWTPLHAACTCGHTNIAKVLIKRGANLLALNADQNMPYDICEDDATLEFIEQAMTRKGITQEQINDLRSSKEKEIIKEVEEFIGRDGDITFKDDVGATILHLAAANGYVDLAKLFLRHATDVNLKDDDGWTPLHAAACWCQIEIVEILGFDFNADPFMKNKVGEVPADVTEDEDVKTMLQKLMKMHKDKKSRLKKIQRFNGKNHIARPSGMRGLSFRDRSKRDKKSPGISAVEAKSEAEYWHKGQETDLFDEDNTSASTDGLRSSDPACRETLNHIQNSSVLSEVEIDPNNNSSEMTNSIQAGQETLVDNHRNTLISSLQFWKKRGTSLSCELENGETLNNLKQRRSKSLDGINPDTKPNPITIADLTDDDKMLFYSKLNGSDEKRKSFCTLL